MSLPSSELWPRIHQAGLVTEAECQQWAAEVLPSLTAEEQVNGLKILQRLIELKKLTKYQAKILAGQSKLPLRVGTWHVLERLKDPLWSNWLVVTHQSSATSTSSNASPMWARVLDSQLLEQLQLTAPSLPRALKLASLKHPVLQATLLPELLDKKLLVLVSPLVGQPLNEKFVGGGCSVELSLSIVRQIASALAELHRLGFAHGRVLPDRIYWQADQIMLAVDPLCAATAISQASPAGLIGQSLEGLSVAQFLAPEFQIPGQLPTPATDIYALGCLWWWLLTGAPPIQETSAELTLQHARPLPQLPRELPMSAPVRRCMRHMLGRNLSSRFASADALLAALDVAVRPIVTTAEQQPEAPSSPAPLAATQSAHVAPSHDLSTNPALTASITNSKTKTRLQKRRRGIPWLVPVLAGCGLLVLMLVALKYSGVLQPNLGSDQSTNSGGLANVNPAPTGTDLGSLLQRDPRSDLYQIVNGIGDGIADGGEPLLWVPPNMPAPLPIDYLPPGGQLFVSWRPAELLAEASAGRDVLATLDQQLSPLLANVSHVAGIPLEEISQVTLAFYASPTSSGPPQVCLRCELVSAITLSLLKSAWGEGLTTQSFGEQALLVNSKQLGYYVFAQPLVDSQSVKEFGVGPVDLMREVAEARGGAGPLVHQLENLWRNSDRQAELSLFGSAPFLLTEGRVLLGPESSRLRANLKELLGGDLRAVGLQMRFQPQWYIEARFIGANALEAGKVLAGYQRQLAQLPAAMEARLISQTPHPYWRAIALRLPHMLRTLAEYTRFGVENGTAIINAYLPSEAASNILLGGWIALQDDPFTVAVNASSTTTPTVATVNTVAIMNVEEFLARPIRLSFDQEPIEGALSLVAAEANDGLPPGSVPLRVVLDGDAFEKAGITRNQQLRDFRIDGQAVRVALTEIAKRGNPVTTVTDTRHDDQKLIWVVVAEPDNPQRSMISLTTRTAAQAAGVELPVEFR